MWPYWSVFLGGSESIAEIDANDVAIQKMAGIKDMVDHLLNRGLGEHSKELNWRKHFSRNFDDISDKLIRDYKVRRDVHGCNPLRL